MIKKIVCHPVMMTLVLLVVATLLMNGCAGVAPIDESIITTPTAELMSDAEQALERGDYNQAELQMERAMRVDPRNGRIWHLMARIRYEQGDYGQTVQFCLKSNTLANHDRILMRQNWVLLEKAYTMLGETIKADDARHKAATIWININDGKTVKVRINDRGPFVKGRIIDLTRAAFAKIEDLNKGLAEIEIRVID